MSANDRQVGGQHYKHPGFEDHWDRAWRLKLDYFQAQITKYVERCWLKNGIQDLEKARHFLDKYIELKRAEATAQADAEVMRVRGPDRRVARDDRREWPFGDPAEAAGLQTAKFGACGACNTSVLCERQGRCQLLPAEPQAHGYVDQDR